MSSTIRFDRFRSVENLLPIFELLEQSTNLGAKEEALRILSQVSEDKECRDAISQAGGLATLVEILKTNSSQMGTLVAPVVRVIRNLANDGVAMRKALRHFETTQHLVQLISQHEETSIAVDAIAALGYLAHHDQQTKGLIRKMGGVPLFVRILHADATKPITCYAAAALHNLIDGSARNKSALLAAGAVPRLVQLLDSDCHNPVLEVAVRTLQKLSEKCEQAQSEIRRSKGLSKLIELQAKVTEPSLLNWIEQCLQALKMSEKETNESKLLLSLGTAFQKEFDQLRIGSEEVLHVLREISQSMASSFQDLNQRTNAMDEESAQLKDLIVDRDHQIAELSGLLDEKSTQFQKAQDLVQQQELQVQEAQEKLGEKEGELTDCLNSLQQKETYLAKVESKLHAECNVFQRILGALQERESQVKLLEATLDEKTQHMQYMEGLLLDKERQLEAALVEERSYKDKIKTERDVAIVELTQTLRDLVSVSRPGSPGASPLDHHQICEISNSIQSLIQAGGNTQENNKSIEPLAPKDHRPFTKGYSMHSPVMRSASVPMKPSHGAQETTSSPLPKHLSLNVQATQMEEDSHLQKARVRPLTSDSRRGSLTSPLSRTTSHSPQWRQHLKPPLN